VWGIPLLLFPSSLLSWLGFVVPEPSVFLRLLGAAYIALVVGYCFGLQQALRGTHPLGVIWAGIVSNGGACLLLGFFGLYGTWSRWGAFAQAVMWGSLAGIVAITAGLVFFGLCESSSGNPPAQKDGSPLRPRNGAA
jgi:hypothetical protein